MSPPSPKASGDEGRNSSSTSSIATKPSAASSAVLDLVPLGIEHVALAEALGRVLAADVVSPVDVPSFDRSNVDGFAVVAQDTFGASEEVPRRVRLSGEVIHTGVVPAAAIRPGEAVAIATGGMVPRGADAVVMVEHADDSGGELRIGRAVPAGSGVSFAGTDITAGETVLRRGRVLTSRDTGVLAAIGVAAVDVWRRPLVAILSTGDEIIAPGQPMQPARVYDSNAQVLADAVRELGGEPLRLGIVADDADALRAKLREALDAADVVLLSGGTSKGAGDVSYRVVAELTDPGIVAHGVALKPGKPICLAATEGRPVVVLPGFPTSAIFTFHEFVAPVISAMAGRSVEPPGRVQARLAVRVNSEIGRTEYLLVGLVDTGQGEPAAGRVSDGPGLGQRDDLQPRRRLHHHRPARGDRAGGHDGHRAAARPRAAAAGPGRDRQPLHRSRLPAGRAAATAACARSSWPWAALAGLEAAKRGECDLAGIHLLDPASGEYNRPFLTPALDADPRLRPPAGHRVPAGRRPVRMAAPGHRGRGDGGARPRLRDGQPQPGQRHARADRPAARPARSRPAMRCSRATTTPWPPPCVQGRADWGVTLETVATAAGLGFLPVQHEHYDFVVPSARAERPGVAAFRAQLDNRSTREALARLGMKP